MHPFNTYVLIYPSSYKAVCIYMYMFVYTCKKNWNGFSCYYFCMFIFFVEKCQHNLTKTLMAGNTKYYTADAWPQKDKLYLLGQQFSRFGFPESLLSLVRLYFRFSTLNGLNEFYYLTVFPSYSLYLRIYQFSQWDNTAWRTYYCHCGGHTYNPDSPRNMDPYPRADVVEHFPFCFSFLMVPNTYWREKLTDYPWWC